MEFDPKKIVKDVVFRDPIANCDGYYSHRNAKDRDGNLTYASMRSRGMNYKQPVSHGKPARYFQFLMEIVANPGLTRKEILKKVYPEDKMLLDSHTAAKLARDKNSPTYRNWQASRDAAGMVHVSDAAGYMNTYFSALNADGFIRATTKNTYYPTAKAIKFVEDFIDEVDPQYVPENLKDRDEDFDLTDMVSRALEESNKKPEDKKPLREGKFHNIYGFKVDDKENPCHVEDSVGNHWEIDLWSSGEVEPFESFEDAVEDMNNTLRDATTEEELGTDFDHYAREFTKFVQDILGEKYIKA